ncbi:MAG: site-specific integrase [Bauldia sp.]|nr:site-specific integrase [Bauldia sp.]
MAFSNLQRRGAVYYLRIAVPADLQATVGKREIWKSLRTKNVAEARERLPRELADLHDQWKRLREGKGLSEAEVRDAVWRRYSELVAADEELRQSLPTEDDLDEIWRILVAEFGDYDLEAWGIFRTIRDRFDDERRERRERLAQLRTDSARGETRLVAETIAKEIRDRRLPVQKGTKDYRRLAQGIQRAELEALTRAEERDAGNFGGAPKDPLVAPPPPSKPKGEDILTAFDAYATENPRNVIPDTLAQSRMAIELFVSTLGPGATVDQIDKKAARDWKALLLKYPVKAAETAAFNGLSMREIVKANETIGKPAISARTVNRYLSSLGAFADWLVTHDYLATSPVADMHIKIDKRKRKTLPFSVEQLNTILRSPLFTGCQSDEKMHLAGNHQIRDHRYWLPLVMLFAGARPGEIAQLDVSDVRQLHGQWIIHITDEGDGDKSVKTAGSARVVPVHPELVRLGFIEHCERARQAGQAKLFPEVDRNARGQIAAKFSREFGRYLTRISIKDGRGLSLYSFRHGFIDALRRAEYLDEQFGFLVGHTKPTTTGQYGQLPQGMLRQRVEMIEAVSYPGLTLSHLHTH